MKAKEIRELTELIIELHEKLDSEYSDNQRFDVIRILCELLGCKIPQEIIDYHDYWRKGLAKEWG